ACRCRYRHRHERRTADETVSGFHSGRFPDRTPLRWDGARPCHLAQARAHDGRRRDGDERARQRFGVHRAPARGLNAMNLPRRQFLHLAAGAAALPAVSSIAWAQAYPTRPVSLIVFVPAGGTPDIIARLIGQSLSQRLRRSVVIDTGPGAGGNLALQAVARAPADGYTLLMVATPHAINVTLYEKSPINVTHDIVPVASINSDAFVLLVNPSFPAKTVAEFIAYAKANPGKINLASNGTGNLTHLSG